MLRKHTFLQLTEQFVGEQRLEDGPDMIDVFVLAARVQEDVSQVECLVAQHVPHDTKVHDKTFIVAGRFDESRLPLITFLDVHQVKMLQRSNLVK